MGVALRAAVPPLPYQCVHCKKRPVQTKVAIPFVRGLVVWFKIGDKVAVGCVSCVRQAAFGEAGLSALIGWFSPFALVINPFMIVHNVFLGLLTGNNPSSARSYLATQGFPTGEPEDVARVCHVLATTMLGDDWTKEASERSWSETIEARSTNFSAERLAAVVRIGEALAPGFNRVDFELCVVGSAGLGHPLHIADACSRVLSSDDLTVVRNFLSEVSRQLEFSVARQGTFKVILRALGQLE